MSHLKISTRWIAVLALCAMTLAACDSNEDSVQPVDEVVVIGTQVNSDFINTGEFGLSATPLDAEGQAILSEEATGEVTIDAPGTTNALQAKSDGGLNGTVTISGINTASGPLAVTVNIDGSGSMSSNDPNRARVDGAKAFVDQLESSGEDYEVAMATYAGFNQNPPLSFTSLLLDFSDDAQALKDSSELVRASGSTPTYESLAELLIYSEDVRPQSNYEKAIVLLSDGFPNSTALKDSVCNDAVAKSSPIYTIGLGPASDQSDSLSIDPAAVQEMQSLASCTNGGYQGIDPDDILGSTREIYQRFATGTAKGSVVYRVQVDPTALQQHFSPGDLLSGTLTITSGGQSAGGTFSFRVPDPNVNSTLAPKNE